MLPGPCFQLSVPFRRSCRKRCRAASRTDCDCHLTMPCAQNDKGSCITVFRTCDASPRSNGVPSARGVTISMNLVSSVVATVATLCKAKNFIWSTRFQEYWIDHCIIQSIVLVLSRSKELTVFRIRWLPNKRLSCFADQKDPQE